MRNFKMNKKLYKLFLSVAFILQVTNFNLSCSADNNDIRFIATKNGDCFIEKSGELLSMTKNNQNKYSYKDFEYKTYNIDNSNCITQLINDTGYEHNEYKMYSHNNISNFNDIFYNIENDKHEEYYYEDLIQSNYINDSIETLKIEPIEIKDNYNEIKLPVFEPNISAIIYYEFHEEKITTGGGDDYIFKNDLLKDIDFSKILGTTAGIAEDKKTCCDWLSNVFKKATSCIKNIFSSNTNINENNITEVLINNDIEDNNNYDADISNNNDSKDSIIYDDKSNAIRNNK